LLNPTHATRHDTRLPVLTEVDGSMAPLEELDDSTKGLKRWHGAGLLWNCSIPITNTKGLYLYPCPNTTPGRLRVQHSLPKLMSQRQCPSHTRHQFVASLYPGHVITRSRMLPFSNANSPSVEWWRTIDRKYLCRILWGEFSAEWCFFNKLYPQVSPFLVPIFGVNTNDGTPPTASIFAESFEENFLSNGAYLPNSAHKSVPFLYQFLVLTMM
jgi:hypothetical protein